MLTEEQVAHFFREGYVLVPSLVPCAATERIAQRCRPALEQALQDHLKVGCAKDEWFAAQFEKKDLRSNDPDVHHLLWHPNVIAAGKQLLGTGPMLIHGMLAQVAPGGKGLPWHQDNMYSHVIGGAINIFTAVVGITPDMGGLWVAPRTHIYGVFQSRSAPKGSNFSAGHRQLSEEPDNGIPLPPMQPGDTCIFDRYLLHRSVPNQTDKLRLAYASQFHAAHARQADGNRITPGISCQELATLFGEVA